MRTKKNMYKKFMKMQKVIRVDDKSWKCEKKNIEDNWPTTYTQKRKINHTSTRLSAFRALPMQALDKSDQIPCLGFSAFRGYFLYQIPCLGFPAFRWYFLCRAWRGALRHITGPRIPFEAVTLLVRRGGRFSFCLMKLFTL